MKSVLIVTFDNNKALREKVNVFVKEISSDCEDVLYASSSVVEPLVKKLKDSIE